MSPLWTSQAIAAATGGTASAAFAVNAISFDSREVAPGALFVALHGSESDGHRYLAPAFAAGAAGALVSTACPEPHVRVADTQAGLEALGRAARQRASAARVLAVTGSVGKTSIKEALRACLAAQGATHASVKSYNTHTGVPLSLARMPADTRWAVFELGMNHRGEIAPLSAQVRPHVALISWVGSAHIEHLGSEAAIADEKADIFTGLAPGGTAILPFDNPWRDRLIAAAQGAGVARIIGFGLGAGAQVRATDVVQHGAGTAFTAQLAGAALPVRLAGVGGHHVHNALAVLAAIAAAGADVGAAAATLGMLAPLPGRGRVVALRIDARLIDEAYNANPDSMAAALAALAAMPCAGRRLAVLGEMRELGTHAPAAHAALAPQLEAAGVTQAALLGEAMGALAAAWPRAVPVADVPAALAWARATLRPGDALLVKGSNGVGLGALVAALEGED